MLGFASLYPTYISLFIANIWRELNFVIRTPIYGITPRHAHSDGNWNRANPSELPPIRDSPDCNECNPHAEQNPAHPDFGVPKNGVAKPLAPPSAPVRKTVGVYIHPDKRRLNSLLINRHRIEKSASSSGNVQRQLHLLPQHHHCLNHKRMPLLHHAETLP